MIIQLSENCFLLRALDNTLRPKAAQITLIGRFDIELIEWKWLIRIGGNNLCGFWLR
jgi:hypothetical protein